MKSHASIDRGSLHRRGVGITRFDKIVAEGLERWLRSALSRRNRRLSGERRLKRDSPVRRAPLMQFLNPTQPINHSRHPCLRKFTVRRFAVLSGLILVSGCGTCNQRGTSISADSRHVLKLVRDPVATGDLRSVPVDQFKVTGRNFTPGAPITIFFRNWPARDPIQARQFERAITAGTDITTTTTNDVRTTISSTSSDQGSFTLISENRSGLPDLDHSYDPVRNPGDDWDVNITARETHGNCFGVTQISTREIFCPRNSLGC
jgi:hypothetical protein